MMFKVLNFDSWNIYDGASEGSGRSEKIWLISDRDEIGLFKFPKIDPTCKKETTEYISEHLAHQIGNIIEVPTAKVEIGYRNGRIGSMSHLVQEPAEMLIEGIDFISGKFPLYNAETMQDENDGSYYCIDHIFKSVPPQVIPSKIWIEMMLFDFLIGNADRHQSNWALLMKIISKEPMQIQVRQCPLYDNGSSLCSYVSENQIELLLGNDDNRFNALVNSKSKSIIRIDGTNKSRPRHYEVAKYLIETYPVAQQISQRFIDKLTEPVINNIISEYPSDILSSQKGKLIVRFLVKKLELLNEILNERNQ